MVTAVSLQPLGLTMPAGLLGAAAVAGAANTLWQYNREMLGQAVFLEEPEFLIFDLTHGPYCIASLEALGQLPSHFITYHTILYTRYHLMQQDATNKD